MPINCYRQTKYNRFEFDNDMVLIRLNTPLVFDVNVSAICIAEKPIKPQQTCVTAGWSFSAPQGMVIQRNWDMNIK